MFYLLFTDLGRYGIEKYFSSFSLNHNLKQLSRMPLFFKNEHPTVFTLFRTVEQISLAGSWQGTKL